MAVRGAGNRDRNFLGLGGLFKLFIAILPGNGAYFTNDSTTNAYFTDDAKANRYYADNQS